MTSPLSDHEVTPRTNERRDEDGCACGRVRAGGYVPGEPSRPRLFVSTAIRDGLPNTLASIGCFSMSQADFPSSTRL